MLKLHIAASYREGIPVKGGTKEKLQSPKVHPKPSMSPL